MSASHASTAKSDEINQPQAAGTARFITRCLLVASWGERHAALLPAGSRRSYQRLLLAAGDRSFVQAACHRSFRSVFQAVINFILPGIILHYIARKRCLEEWLRQACGQDRRTGGSCRQVVVLGAGLDTLAWRLSDERPDVAFVELDRPAALSLKEKAIAAGGRRRRNLTFLPADLGRESLADALRRSPRFDPSVPTLFLAEGLLMYLSPERVRSLFREIRTLGMASVPHRFAFTFMEARLDGRIGFRRSNRAVDWWLRWQGEPFRWSHAPDALPAFLESVGFTLRELVSGDTLRARFLAPAGLQAAPLAMGEWLALAEMEAAA